MGPPAAFGGHGGSETPAPALKDAPGDLGAPHDVSDKRGSRSHSRWLAGSGEHRSPKQGGRKSLPLSAALAKDGRSPRPRRPCPTSSFLPSCSLLPASRAADLVRAKVTSRMRYPRILSAAVEHVSCPCALTSLQTAELRCRFVNVSGQSTLGRWRGDGC